MQIQQARNVNSTASYRKLSSLLHIASTVKKKYITQLSLQHTISLNTENRHLSSSVLIIKAYLSFGKLGNFEKIGNKGNREHPILFFDSFIDFKT